MVIEGQLVLGVGAEPSHWYLVALGGEGQWVSGPRVEEQQVFAVGKEGEDAFALDSKLVVELHAFEPDAFGACFRILSEPVVEQHAFGLDSTPVVEQHAFELDAAVGVCSRMLSKLLVEQHAFGLVPVWLLARDGSVAWVTQHEGNLIFSISAQRHSARSRAIFHCAREFAMSIPLVD